MAQFDCEDFARFALDFVEVATLPNSVIADMLKAEAGVIVEAQKATAKSMGVVDTGLMVDSIRAGSIKKTRTGGKAIHVYPQGSRTRDGITTSNAEIAFINEFGKHGQPARPFIKAANERYADEAVDAAFKVYDSYLRSKNL